MSKNRKSVRVTRTSRSSMSQAQLKREYIEMSVEALRPYLVEGQLEALYEVFTPLGVANVSLLSGTFRAEMVKQLRLLNAGTTVEQQHARRFMDVHLRMLGEAEGQAATPEVFQRMLMLSPFMAVQTLERRHQMGEDVGFLQEVER